MYLKSTRRFSVKRICPRSRYIFLIQFLDLTYRMSLEVVLSLQTAEEKAERVAAGGGAELDQLRGRHSSGRARCFSYPTFILVPLQHRTPRMILTIPNFKCLQ